MLRLQSDPNAVYSEKTIDYHLLNVAASRTIVSNLYDAPCEGIIRYRLGDIVGLYFFEQNQRP
jgi:hypothetical protein